jgi:hypothetical protein
MSNIRKDIIARLGSLQPKEKMGRAEKVMTDGSVHLDFKEAKEWLSSVSDDSLKYIISDANAAAKAMGSDGKKFNYYTDLALTAGQILRSTKRGGHRLNKSPTEFELEDACWDGYKAVGTKKKDGKTVPNCVPKAKSSRLGSAAKFATPEQTVYSELFNFWSDRKTNQASHISALQALIRKARAMPNWKPLSARVGNKPSLHDLVDTQEDSINKIKSSRPGAKVKFETYPSDEVSPTQGQGAPQSAKDLEESIAYWTDYVNRIKKGLLAYPKAISKASGYEKENLLHQLHRQQSDVKSAEKSVSAFKALLAKLKSNPSMSHINGKGRLIKLQRPVRPGNAVKFATPEQIKEEYRQLKQVPKQRLFDMWARETLGRVHNADIQDQDKSNMAVDLIRSRFPRKDYEAAGFKVESSRPGAKVK